MKLKNTVALTIATAALTLACLGEEPQGIAPATPASTTVKMDFFHKPLPDIPLPNDLATRYDVDSPTGRRINASMIAPTGFESHTRQLIDELDGWGVFQYMTVPFTGPIDITSITKAHRDKDYDLKDDVIYLINIDPRSTEYGRIHHMDLGNGNYPVVLESLDKYWKNDPRGWTTSLLFEEEDEDLNNNGVLDAGEDTDADGILDKPNYLPGKTPAKTDLAGRADALMSFYERETDTLIVRPLDLLQERTTYAVVVTRRLLDAKGKPVGSPYDSINHTAQNTALQNLPEVLPAGLTLEDVAFTWSFTTQSVNSQITAVREGLYGKGKQAHLKTKFPAKLKGLETLVDTDHANFKTKKNIYILQSEHFVDAYKQIATGLLGVKAGSDAYKTAVEANKYIDYHVIGSFSSPQLWERFDKNGRMIPYNNQRWPNDLDTKVATARDEPVYFWLTVPRKEVSPRGQGKPAGTVILGHGYGGNRTDILSMGGLMAKWGMSAIAIDCVSHGLDLGSKDKALAEVITAQYGLKAFMKAVFKDRAWDQNFDGNVDSGADFWSAYVFHTRDMVRQSAVDYMQLVRILRSFDGTRVSDLDLDGDGKKELAGDFDADGNVDIGGKDSIIAMTGGSLGGIMSMTVGGVEPEVSVIAPVAGGAGLADVGIRSRQGGVPEAFILRAMGPIITGTLDTKTSETKMEFILPDLNSARTLPFASVKGVKPGDTVLIENLANKERGCGVVQKDGKLRMTIPSDNPTALKDGAAGAYSCSRDKGTKDKEQYFTGDKLQVSFYSGYAIGGEDCKLAEAAKGKAYHTIDKFEADLNFQGMYCEKEKALIAPTEGLGLRRADPALRRLTSFIGFIIEPGDPVVFMPGLLRDPPKYSNAKEGKATHSLVITTMGDMNVPASSGLTAGRVAGLIDYLHEDPRYGMPANQMVIETYTAEAVHTLKRYTHPTTGAGVHLDVENFSQGTDYWGIEIPRLAKPLRLGLDRQDGHGGVSGAIFPMSRQDGSHGFDMPGEMTDMAIKACQTACKKTGGSDPCGCLTRKHFDIGKFMFNMIGRYFSGGGKALSTNLCNSRDDCHDFKKAPAVRDKKTLQ